MDRNDTTEKPQAKNSDPEMVTGGHLAARALANDGIDTVFTLSGGNVVDIYSGCEKEGIRIIDFRHEQVAAHAADAYARISGQTGCLVTTSGPGCTNAVTGLATALQSQTPLLHISGAASSGQHLMGSLQEFDHVKLLSAVTKFAASVRTPERIADMVSMACREANSGVPGPVFLEIGRDMLDGKIRLSDCHIPQPGHYRTAAAVMCAPSEIEKFASLLVKAERPVVFYGSQVWNVRAHRAAARFMREACVPAYTNGASRGMISQDEELLFDRTRHDALRRADLIIVAGTPFDFRLDYGKSLNPQAAVVQIDRDVSVIGKNRDVTLGLPGHAGLILDAVCDALTDADRKTMADARRAWVAELKAGEKVMLERIAPALYSDSVPVNPYRVARELNEFLTDNTIYIGDGGDVVTISAQAVRPRGAGRWMDPGPLGSLGVGTGFAIGAGLASPGSDVLCYYGDGSFSMTAFDMETANRFKVPYLAVVGNNSAMNQIRYAQIEKYGAGHSPGTLLSDLPYGKFAQMMGGYGEEVSRPEDIAPALRRARESIAKTGCCAVVNIWVDPKVWSPGTMARYQARRMKEAAGSQ